MHTNITLYLSDDPFVTLTYILEIKWSVSKFAYFLDGAGFRGMNNETMNVSGINPDVEDLLRAAGRQEALDPLLFPIPMAP